MSLYKPTNKELKEFKEWYEENIQSIEDKQLKKGQHWYIQHGRGTLIAVEILDVTELTVQLSDPPCIWCAYPRYKISDVNFVEQIK